MTLSGSNSPQNAGSDISQEMNSDSNNEENRDEDDGFDDKLQKLKDLKDDGVITEEEFEEKKQDIMDDI